MNRVEQLMEEAFAAFAADREKAARLFEEVITIDENNQLALIMRARCEADPRMARMWLERAHSVAAESAEGRQAAQLLAELPSFANEPNGQPPEFPEGTVLAARYVIVRKLGEGGSSRTYLAEDRRFRIRHGLRKQQWLIKQYSRRLPTDPDKRKIALEGIELEALILADLGQQRHLKVPRVVDQLVAERCLVLEYIEGDTLEQVLQRQPKGRLHERKALRYAHDVCSVLAHMHQRRDEAGRRAAIIHRDVKPKNIICGPGEHAYLIDFGIAQLFPGEAQSNATSPGTFGYAPEEQQAGRAEPRSDIYALGMTLAACVRGEDPADATGISAVKGHGQKTKSIRASKPVEDIINRTTAKDPTDRLDALGMLAALDALLTKKQASTQTLRMGIVIGIVLALAFLNLFPDIRRFRSQNANAASRTVQTRNIPFGQPKTGPFTPDAPVEEWTFYGIPQQHIEILLDARRRWLSSGPAFALLDIDEYNLEGRNCAEINLHLRCELRAEGEYTVRVYTERLDGSYTLTVRDAPEAGTPPQEANDVSAEAPAGTRVTWDCLNNDKRNNPYAVPKVQVNGKNISREYTLEQDATVRMRFIDQNRSNDQCAIKFTLSPKKLVLGSNPGYLSPTQPVQVWTFDGRVGQDVVIIAESEQPDNPSSGIPGLLLFDPEGQYVEFTSFQSYSSSIDNQGVKPDRGRAQIQATLRKQGLYTLVVENPWDKPGPYNLSLDMR